MKYAAHAGIAIVLTVLLTIGVLGFDRGYDETRWLRLEDADGLLSFCVPDDFLIDKEGTLDFRVVAYRDGATFEIEADRFGAAGKRFESLTARNGETELHSDLFTSAKNAKVRVKQFVSGEPLSYRIYIQSGSRYYRIFITSKGLNAKIIDQFLGSIRVDNTSLHQDKRQGAAPSQTIRTKEISTSPEIKTARLRKQPKRVDTYTHYPIDSFKSVAAAPSEYTRRAVIVDKNPPVLLAFAPGQHRVKVVLELLANGHVGKVVVYSNLSDKLVPAVIESALGIKFVPAKKEAVYVDSVEVIDYSMNVGKPVIHYDPMPRSPRFP